MLTYYHSFSKTDEPQRVCVTSVSQSASNNGPCQNIMRYFYEQSVSGVMIKWQQQLRTRFIRGSDLGQQQNGEQSREILDAILAAERKTIIAMFRFSAFPLLKNSLCLQSWKSKKCVYVRTTSITNCKSPKEHIPSSPTYRQKYTLCIRLMSFLIVQNGLARGTADSHKHLYLADGSSTFSNSGDFILQSKKSWIIQCWFNHILVSLGHYILLVGGGGLYWNHCLSLYLILYGWYLLNRWIICDQTWYDCVLWARESCRKIGSLSSRSQQRLIW